MIRIMRMNPRMEPLPELDELLPPEMKGKKTGLDPEEDQLSSSSSSQSQLELDPDEEDQEDPLSQLP